MADDRDYFRHRAARAGSGPFDNEDCESVEVAGHLALAYAALARRRGLATKADATDAVDTVVASAAELGPLVLQD